MGARVLAVPTPHPTLDSPVVPLHASTMVAHRQQAGRSPHWILAPVWLVLLLAAGLAVAPGCRKHEPVLEDLASLDEFKARFNRDEGTPRVVLLLSPT